MGKKLLYISCGHPALEYDDLKLIDELGYDWFSTGLYQNPRRPVGKAYRGVFNNPPRLDLIIRFHAIHPNNSSYRLEWEPVFVNKEFVDLFDLVVISSPVPYPFYIRDNWAAIKHKPILVRTFAQVMPHLEMQIEQYRKQANLKVMRMSPKESVIPGFSGCDFVGRHWVDEEKFNNWVGNEGYCLTFNNHCAQRSEVSNFGEYQRVHRKTACRLYGQFNERVSECLGSLSAAEQLQAYQSAACYFALGTKPACVTYNLVEALMVGCPVLTWGPKMGDTSLKAYEVPDLLEDGKEIIFVESAEEAVAAIGRLIRDKGFAKQLGTAGRQKALQIFSKTQVKEQWRAALTSLE